MMARMAAATLVPIFTALLACNPGPTSNESSGGKTPVPQGTWGGTDCEVQVGPTGAVALFRCELTVTLHRPLLMDERGMFEVSEHLSVTCLRPDPKEGCGR